MKQLIFCIFLLSLQNVKSQDSLHLYKEGTRPFYKAKLYLYGGQFHKGFLISVKDSSVFISEEKIEFAKKRPVPEPFHKTQFTGDSVKDRSHYDISQYHYKTIESISIMNQKAKTRAIVIGAVVGIIAGAIIGVSQGSDQGLFGFPAGAKGLYIGILGGGVGALAGLALSASFEKKYTINGDWKNLAVIPYKQ